MERDVLYIEIDGKNYIIVDKININKIDYLYLSNEIDSTDFIVQKISRENEEEMIVNLDSSDEFDLAMIEFGKKHLNDN